MYSYSSCLLRMTSTSFQHAIEQCVFIWGRVSCEGGGVIIQWSVCKLVVFIPVHAFQLNSAGFLSPLQLRKVEGHTFLLKDLNVCVLMEAQCQARNMGSVRSDQSVLMFCGFTPRQMPLSPPFQMHHNNSMMEGVLEGKGLPGAAYGLLLLFNSLFTVFNTAV